MSQIVDGEILESASPASDREANDLGLLKVFRARLANVALGLAYALQPKRWRFIAPIAWVCIRDAVGGRPIGPAMWRRRPFDSADGLMFVSSDLSVRALFDAYAHGVFPFSHFGPVKWWAPPERMTLRPGCMKIEKGTKRLLKNRKFEIRFDRAFRKVVEACAAPRTGKLHLTWITPRIADAFTELHRAGHAHSVEVYEEGVLVGGLYGVAIGRVFFTESQFAARRDASKVALAVLDAHLAAWGFVLNDGKDYSAHLERAGFELVGRDILKAALALPAESVDWTFRPEIVGELQ